MGFVKNEVNFLTLFPNFDEMSTCPKM